MSQKHEILWLNRNRIYVLVNNTWYDANKDLGLELGVNFLTGRIEEILPYEEYTQTFPESTNTIYPYITDKTISGGFLRKLSNGERGRIVEYGINPTYLLGNSQAELELPS